ncbi:MAG: hypothetical protein Q9M31_03425 [Mariprofundus sp.]|nr:hypothetical protein [Mariprofundus sp.]
MLNNSRPRKRMMVIALFITVIALAAAVLATPAVSRSIQLNSAASFPVDI